MANHKKYLTPWLQDILAEFKSHPSKKTYDEMMSSPLPERIKTALREAYKRWISSLVFAVPRKQNRERERNSYE